MAGGLNTYAYVGGNPVNRTDPEGLYWGIAQSYLEGQVNAWISYGKAWLRLSGAAGVAATSAVSAPAIASTTKAMACYAAETAVATSPVWGNPRVQQGTIDLISSMFPGSPSPNGLGLLGFGTGLITNPHEILR